MPRKTKPISPKPTASSAPTRRAALAEPSLRVVDRLTGNLDYDYEAVIETDLPDGSPYRVGVLVTRERATYRHDKAAAELARLGVEVDPQTLADIAIG